MELTKFNSLLFWNIGKSVYENQKHYNNVFQKYSDYCSYYYGNSLLFSRENIHLMKRFYMNFPIFHKRLSEFTWEMVKLLLRITNKKERMFYYYLSLYLHCNYDELLDLIMNKYYSRLNN